MNVSGEQSDVLEALLGGWWTGNLTLLFRREVVEHAGGWDEILQVGQDRDFFLSVAMAGADIRYQPGCWSVYRRYGNVTVATVSRSRWLENHWHLLEKAEAKLQVEAQLSERYRRALAKSSFI